MFLLTISAYQPTLFEMMGIPRNSDKTKQNINTEVTDNGGNIGEVGVIHDVEGSSHDDDDVPTEYIPERKFQERIHRLEWNNHARDSTDQEAGIVSGSIFDTVLPLTQGHQDEADVTKSKETASIPLWDDLFESKNKAREKTSTENANVGLGDLLCLFEDGTEDSDREDDSGSTFQASNANDRIDPNLLSQGAQNVANEVISTMPSREMLEGSYPNWKENVYFALMQKDSNELEQALDNVRHSRMRLQAQKEELLKEC